MDIHEYQAKELLAGFGVAIPRGGVAYSPEQAVYRAAEIGGNRWAVKAQIHSGARGKRSEIDHLNGMVYVDRLDSLDDLQRTSRRELRRLPDEPDERHPRQMGESRGDERPAQPLALASPHPVPRTGSSSGSATSPTVAMSIAFIAPSTRST